VHPDAQSLKPVSD